MTDLIAQPKQTFVPYQVFSLPLVREPETTIRIEFCLSERNVTTIKNCPRIVVLCSYEYIPEEEELTASLILGKCTGSEPLAWDSNNKLIEDSVYKCIWFDVLLAKIVNPTDFEFYLTRDNGRLLISRGRIYYNI